MATTPSSVAFSAMKSIRWTKQVINMPLRQIAHATMDLSLSLETQSNLSKDHQEAVAAFAAAEAAPVIVLIGVPPTEPSSAFGYIQQAEPWRTVRGRIFVSAIGISLFGPAFRLRQFLAKLFHFRWGWLCALLLQALDQSQSR